MKVVVETIVTLPKQIILQKDICIVTRTKEGIKKLKHKK
jgi:hypothetical protein